MWLATTLFAVALCVALVVIIIALEGYRRLGDYNERHPVYYAPRQLLSEALPSLKDGDLLLFASSVHAPTNSMLTLEYFSHAGVVVRDGSANLWISEATPGLPLCAGRHLRYGGDLSPLQTRLAHYTGLVYLAARRAPLSAGDLASLRERARDAVGVPYAGLFRSAAEVLGFASAARHCFQHVAHVLGMPGLLRSGPLTVCRRVCALAGGPDYTAPTQLLCDLQPHREKDVDLCEIDLGETLLAS